MHWNKSDLVESMRGYPVDVFLLMAEMKVTPVVAKQEARNYVKLSELAHLSQVASKLL
jgi:hypothetical protein